ncbi:Sulfatase N-termina domain-containing protein [Desulfonema limicola]|uniref:Sulfatase N-termina domain-containing protein n=1 Tax=Desulfonema limicola TaxID=45656 RepID=A0A975GGN7_9BACT|nr:LTA synthase family protein [Desulfonema limicola]QTA80412.1 Sulfatase N-termina domain-containing protein [Desulfonema limicola]
MRIKFLVTSISKQVKHLCEIKNNQFSKNNFAVWVFCSIIFVLARLNLVHTHIEGYTNSDWTLLPAVLSHDIRLIALLLFILALATFLPVLNIFFIILTVGLIGVYCLDIIIFYALSHRLYITDILKFGREVSAVNEVVLQLLSQPMGFVLILFTLIWIASTIGWCMASNKRPKRISLIIVCIISVIFGFGFPEPKFIRADSYDNVLENNIKDTVDKPFTNEFREELLKSHELQKKCFSGLNLKPNIIVIAVESFSSYQSKLFSGLWDVTPKLDAIAEKNTYFTNFTANGFTTDHGLIALFAGLNPLPAVNRYNSTNVYSGFGKATNDFYNKIHDIGYETAFLKTASLKFLDEAHWFDSIGFQYFEDSSNQFYNNFRKGAFNAAEDRALYSRLLNWIDEQKSDKPFFIGMMTTSSHPPFIDPRTGLKDIYGTFRYADNTLAQLISQLDERGYFKNGILFITSDHRSMTPLNKGEFDIFGYSAFSRIPLIAIGDHGLPKGEISLPFQQIDLLPSILNYVTEETCITPNQGIFLGGILEPAKFRLHVSGYQRNLIYVDNGFDLMTVKMDGDETRFIGQKPDNSNEIIRFINKNRAKHTAMNGEYNLFVASEIRKSKTPVAEKILTLLPEPYNILKILSGGACNFDKPKTGKNKVFLSGWAVISVEEGVLPDRIAICFEIKGERKFVLPEIVERYDVANYFKNDNLLKSGFGFYIGKNIYKIAEKITLYQLFQGKVYKCCDLNRGT